MTIGEDRILTVDGRRLFVIGCYENPSGDAILDTMANAGFNLILAEPNVQSLDRLHSKGLYGWVSVGPYLDLSTDRPAREAKLRETAGQLAGHPALLNWEGEDESLMWCWLVPGTWQVATEISEQRKRVEALGDKAARDRLLALRDKADDQYWRGELSKMENTVDAIWRELGESPPGPERRLTAAPQFEKQKAAGIAEGRRLLRSLDPVHPLWLNHAAINTVAQLAEFGKPADIVGCDVYPVPEYRVYAHPDIADKSLSCVGVYTDRMQQSAPGRPVWMVLQAFGWGAIKEKPDEKTLRELRCPTLSECRFMTFDAIVHGARGIQYYGTAYVQKDSAFFADLLTLVKELSSLQPVLSSPDASYAPKATAGETWGSIDRGVQVLAKDVSGVPWLLVVNEWPEPLEYSMSGLRAFNGVRFADPVDNRAAVVRKGKIRLSIAGHGVQILRPAGRAAND